VSSYALRHVSMADKLRTIINSQFVGVRADEAATVGILPRLPAAVAATISTSLHCAAQMRVLSCGVRIPLDPEGKPEAIGTRPRRRNPRKYGRDSRERPAPNLSSINSIPDMARQ
jgi:hypothetical protein